MYKFNEDYSNKKKGAVHKLSKVLGGKLQNKGIVEKVADDTPYEDETVNRIKAENAKKAQAKADKIAKAKEAADLEK